jgi:hypothetical protein
VPSRPAAIRSRRLLRLLCDERLEAPELAEQRVVRRFGLAFLFRRGLLEGHRQQLVQWLRQLRGFGRLGERLAELGGLHRRLRLVRHHHVDPALDRMFEILAADLLDGADDLVGDDQHPGLGGIGLEPGKDADRVAGGGQREIDDDDHDIDVADQVRELDQHVAGQVDHRSLESVADLLLQLEEGRSVAQHRLVQRRFGGQHAQFVVGPHHRPFDEKTVDAARILDRVGKAAARLEVEAEGAGPEMDVEVEQGGRPAAFVAHQPGERGGDGRGADAAAHADHRRGDVGLLGGVLGKTRARDGELGMGEGVAQLVGGERLQEIVLDAARDEVSIEPHVVHLAGRDHHRAGLAYLGERIDVAQRIARFAEVDEQDARAGRDRKRLHRVAQPALVHLFRRPAMLHRNRTEHVRRRVVADESGERIAKAGRPRGMEGRVHWF